MKNRMTARKKQSLETRNRIFQCATELFAKNSYEEVKISDICRAAHVSTGAFYHHFATKEDILNEGYRDFDELVRTAWKGHSRTDLFDEIRFLIQFQLEAISANGYLFATQFFKNQLSNKEKYILNPDRFFYQKIRELVAEGVETGKLAGDVFAITENILRVSRGTIYDWCLHEGSYELIPCGIRDIDLVLAFYKNR
jgi:AcrR family transcriptional regulator